MSWRIVVISKRAKLDLQLGYMVVRSEEVTKIVLSEISTILIESTAVSITTSLIAELAKRKIKVIFCDEKKNPSCELVNYYGSHDTSNKVRKQIAWKQNTKETVWTEIVTEKIRKQKELLELLGKEESALLDSYLKEIEWNDNTNREGHAAKVYFNAMFGLDFTRTEDNYINAALNYGYSIILSTFTREVVSNGYITQLGIFHDNMFNQFNLASDLFKIFLLFISTESGFITISEYFAMSISLLFSDNTNSPSSLLACLYNSPTYFENSSGDSMIHSTHSFCSLTISPDKSPCTSFIESPTFHPYPGLHFSPVLK